MLVTTQLARNLKIHVISAADAATLESDLQTWFDNRTEEVVVGIRFETADPSADNRAYILYTE